MAQAQLAQSTPDNPQATDTPYRYFTYLSPAHRSQHPTHGAVYGIEPYVMAGDVYTHAPHVGRGGWSWYTGAAAWLHRAAIESIFGLEQTAQTMCFTPCLPTHWPRASLTLRRNERTLHFILIRALPQHALQAAEAPDATLLRPGQHLRWPDLTQDTRFVIPLMPDTKLMS
jgi:cyclic beta-1,2-glucan synthetase